MAVLVVAVAAAAAAAVVTLGDGSEIDAEAAHKELVSLFGGV